MSLNKYRIPAINLARLEEEIAKLNKRATKLKTDPIRLDIIETVTEKRRNDVIGFDYEQTFYICSVTGEAPKLNGWSLIAVVEPVGDADNLVREIPGETCPVEYRTARMTCDHCGEFRRRNAIFVLRHENGTHKQVGRNCMADFLGHAHPEAILSKAEYIFTFDKLISEAGDEGWGSGGPLVVATTNFVAVTAVVIRRLGWVPKSQASDFKAPTASIAWDICTRPHDRNVMDLIKKENIYAEEADIAAAEAAVKWAAEITNPSSTYLHDLSVCCKQNYVPYKLCGYVASVLTAHRRFLSDNQKVSTSTSKHIGEIDKRELFQGLKIVFTHDYISGGLYSQNRTLVKFVDPNGNVLVWHSSGRPDWIEIGKTFDVKATVTKHSEYQGVAQTEVKRVNVQE